MKIYGLITHDALGGAQVAMKKLADEANKQEKVEFHTVYLYKAFGKVERMPNSKDYIVEENLGAFFKYPLLIYRLFKFLYKNRNAKFLCFLPLANFLGPVIGKIVGVDKIVTSHRNPTWSYNPLLRVLDLFCGFFGLSDAIVCNSQSVLKSLDHYPHRYRKRCRVIYNAYSPPALSATEHYEVFRKNARCKVLAVGRLTDQKNFEFLLEVFSKIPDKDLYIIGDGPNKNRLIQKMNNLNLDNVFFLGARPSIFVISALKQCDIYIQPSLFEGQSNSLIEAISNSCLVISSDIEPQKEVLTNKKGQEVGVIINGFRTDEWVEVMNSLSYEIVKNSSLKDLAYERSLDFSLKIMTNSYLSLMKEPVHENKA